MLSIGSYPVISLADAREARDRAKGQLAKGIDPSSQKRLDALNAANARATTFEVVAAELIEKKRREGRAHRTLEKLRWLYDLAKPHIGARPIAEITAPEILVALRGIESRGQLETAKRLRAVIGEAFRYGVATGRAIGDPTSALKGALTAPTVTHRAAITDPKQFGGLLRAIDGFSGQPTTRAALQLMALLFPRPGELRQAEWSEFDLDGGVWSIPAERMKMRKPHIVPLPPQAVAILRELHPITGRGKLVLPGYGVSGGEGRRIEQRPLSENTMNAALRRMGFASEEMSAHPKRRARREALTRCLKIVELIRRRLHHHQSEIACLAAIPAAGRPDPNRLRGGDGRRRDNRERCGKKDGTQLHGSLSHVSRVAGAKRPGFARPGAEVMLSGRFDQRL